MRVTMLLRSADHISKTVTRNVIAGLLLAATSSAYAQGLPAQVQADLLIQKITASMEVGKAQDALEGLAEYRNLGVKMPPALLFLEARLAAISKDYVRSQKALEEYLAMPEARSDRNYSPALSLYSDVRKGLLQQNKIECEDNRAQVSRIISSRKAGSLFRDCPFAPEMVIIPSGSFEMASKASKPVEGQGQPQHLVQIRTIAVGRFEVTKKEWASCVSAGACVTQSWSTDTNLLEPVTGISFEDSVNFAKWISDTSGEKYRLLSESEWEYASLGGRPYYVWAHTFFGEQYVLKPVDSEGANSYGIFGMTGNAWEWTQDCWNQSFSGAPQDGSAWQSGDCTKRVIRGGHGRGEYYSSASRKYQSSSSKYGLTGFRVARELD